MSGTSWAIVPMGESRSRPDTFWELFTHPAGHAEWRQVTPPGVADNGGLVAGVTGPGTLIAGFRPSQDLAFSPLTLTADGGATWSTAGLLSAGLADVADALATDPAGQLLALTSTGAAELGGGEGPAWTRLTTAKSLAQTRAGRACGLTTLTAAAFGSARTAPPNVPMLAGRCEHPGVAGIFAWRGGAWQAAGPAISPTATGDARLDVEVLRLVTLGRRTEALLAAGPVSAGILLAAWSDDGCGHWQLSAPLRAGISAVRSASFGAGGATGLVLSGGRGVTLAGPGAAWRSVPLLPQWTTVLTIGPVSRLDALSAHGGSFTGWQLPVGTGGQAGAAGPGGAGSWRETQKISVTIPYGSSG